MGIDEILGEVRDGHHRAVDAFLDRHGRDLDVLASWCADALGRGGKVLFFGNGGSAAHAQHLASELVNRFDRDRNALAALALAADASVLTSIANDASFDRVFARQIEALAAKGDVAVALSASGRSQNVLEGLRAARARGVRSAAIVGDGAPEIATLADLALVVPTREVARVQEVQLLAGHVLCRRLEDLLERR
jgi:D-sedoheptulose 7-phosphate isomerase